MRSTWASVERRMATKDRAARAAPALEVVNLDVFYGQAHALQSVSLTLESGVLAVLGRNGMGKTTLCNAITGLVPARGSVKLAGRDILGLPPNAITDLGIGYVPQGRRVWASLSVDEHLRLAEKSARRGEWTAAETAARNSQVANSRCWRSAARCSSIRACW
jgi:ABC-type branched-subunit amino acid transport system ATPase component